MRQRDCINFLHLTRSQRESSIVAIHNPFSVLNSAQLMQNL
jgi:hypothetical protein